MYNKNISYQDNKQIMKRKILLTGSTGFLGKYVLDTLSKDFTVITTHRKKNSMNNNKQNKIYFDLENQNSYRQLDNLSNIDYIIHLAAKIGWSGEKLDDLYQSNVLATEAILNLAKRNNSKMIFSSAALVHGANKRIISDSSKIKIDSPYMESKYLAEKLILFSGIRNCILRIAGIYGFNGPNHLALNKTISDAINKKKLTYGKNLRGKRNYAYVKDVAKNIKFVVTKNICGTHLVAGKDEITIKNMILKIYNLFHPEYKVKFKGTSIKIDQLINHSDKLLVPMSFDQSLIDIKKSIY